MRFLGRGECLILDTHRVGVDTSYILRQTQNRSLTRVLNEARPHSVLQWMTPAESTRQCTDRADPARPEEPEFSS